MQTDLSHPLFRTLIQALAAIATSATLTGCGARDDAAATPVVTELSPG